MLFNNEIDEPSLLLGQNLGYIKISLILCEMPIKIATRLTNDKKAQLIDWVLTLLIQQTRHQNSSSFRLQVLRY